MSSPMTLILTGGGPRSLVATALTLASGQGVRVMLLHLYDQRAAGPVRLATAQRMAQHFRAPLLEVDGLRPLASGSAGLSGELRPLALPRAQLLLAGLAVALEYQASSLVWPINCDGHFEAIAQAQQQLQLVQHLAELEQAGLPTVQLPFIDFTDRQVLELGRRLQAPFHLSWSCQINGSTPCRSCAGCLRRQTSFEALGIEDLWHPAVLSPDQERRWDRPLTGPIHRPS